MSKKLICIEDFYMKSGERSFTKDKKYEVVNSGVFALIDDQNCYHEMKGYEHIFIEGYGYQTPLWRVLNGV